MKETDTWLKLRPLHKAYSSRPLKIWGLFQHAVSGLQPIRISFDRKLVKNVFVHMQIYANVIIDPHCLIVLYSLCNYSSLLWVILWSGRSIENIV